MPIQAILGHHDQNDANVICCKHCGSHLTIQPETVTRPQIAKGVLCGMGQQRYPRQHEQHFTQTCRNSLRRGCQYRRPGSGRAWADCALGAADGIGLCIVRTGQNRDDLRPAKQNLRGCSKSRCAGIEFRRRIPRRARPAGWLCSQALFRRRVARHAHQRDDVRPPWSLAQDCDRPVSRVAIPSDQVKTNSPVRCRQLAVLPCGPDVVTGRM
jgi:hypothetical protein